MNTLQYLQNNLNFITERTQWPALSFFFRIHSDSQKELNTLGHIKNSCHSALKDSHFSQEIFDILMDRVEDLIERIDFQSGAESIGLFVSEKYSYLMHYYIPLPERKYVGDIFAGYESLWAFRESGGYLVFSFENRGVRVLRGNGHHLVLMSKDGQISHLQTLYAHRLPATADKDGKGRKSHEHNFEWEGEFVKAIRSICDAEQLPAFFVGAALCGLTEEKLSSGGIEVLGMANEAHPKCETSRLLETVQKLSLRFKKEQVHDLLDRCSEAEGESRLASGLAECLECASQGRVSMVVLEEPSGGDRPEILPLPAVQHLIAETLQRQGHVQFVPAGMLNEREGVAAILRF